MALNLIRANKLYGQNGRLGIGKTKFHEDFVHKGEDPFVPGTSVPRLKPVNIGPRAIAFFDDEVDALVEGLRAERDKNRSRKSATAQRLNV